jgi:hypothetical protein
VKQRTADAALVLLASTMVAGCAVHHPPGYETLQANAPEEVVEATPWVAYALAPRSWNLPDGRFARVERTEGPRASARGPLEFTIRIEGAPHLSLRCQTDPPELPTRFACWSESLTGVGFAIAPGPGCSGQGSAALGTLRRPDCWRGTLRTGTDTYRVAFAYLERRRWAIDRVSWVDSRGRPVQAADLVAELRVELHRSRDLEETERALLLLHALALHQWIQVTGS